MVAARWRDSSVTAARSRSSVGSAAMSGLRLLPAVRAILAVHGQAPHELLQDRVALVVQLLVDADLRRVVAVDGGVLRVGEERLDGRGRGGAARGPRLAEVGQEGVHLRGSEPDEGRPEARLGLV